MVRPDIAVAAHASPSQPHAPARRRLAVDGSDGMDLRQFVKIKAIEGGDKSECEYIDGVLFRKNVAIRKMPTEVRPRAPRREGPPPRAPRHPLRPLRARTRPGRTPRHTYCACPPPTVRAALRNPIFLFLFLLRTALKDRHQGPPTANRQPPPTANRHQPPTANRQPPIATNRQPPIATNCQPPIATNRQPPIATNRLPPITTNHG